jgi:naphtho-gamma-pyrone polyketide synthase
VYFGARLVSLSSNLQPLVGYLDENPAVSLPSLSYTTAARRIQHNYRIPFPATDTQKFRAPLLQAVEADIQPRPSPPRVTFTFTNQVSYYAGLSAGLFATCSQFWADLINFDAIGTSLGFTSLLPLVDNSVDDVST